MENKITKLNKKLIRKYKREAKREIAKHFHQLEYAHFVSEFIRPKPKYIPLWLWLKLIKLVVKKFANENQQSD